MNQYEFAGGPNYSVSTLPVTVTPAQVVNGIITAGVLTLPGQGGRAGQHRRLLHRLRDRHEQRGPVLRLHLPRHDGPDRRGQRQRGSYVNYYVDEPEPNLDLGLIMGSSQGRPSAVSVFDACQAISGGAMAIEPADGENALVRV